MKTYFNHHRRLLVHHKASFSYYGDRQRSFGYLLSSSAAYGRQTKPETFARVVTNAMDDKEQSFIRDKTADTYGSQVSHFSNAWQRLFNHETEIWSSSLDVVSSFTLINPCGHYSPKKSVCHDFTSNRSSFTNKAVGGGRLRRLTHLFSSYPAAT